MEKIIMDERTGWKYELVGDYYLPVEMPMDKALERMPERQARRAAAAMKEILESDVQLPAEKEMSGQIGRSARINIGSRNDSRFVGWKAVLHAHSILDV